VKGTVNRLLFAIVLGVVSAVLLFGADSQLRPCMARWILRTIAAVAMVGVVHAFMVGLDLPSPAAWVLGAMIYAGLVGVLFAQRPIADKIAFYAVFVVVTLVGAATVCPCTGAHFFLAPIAGLMTLGLAHHLKMFMPEGWLSPKSMQPQGPVDRPSSKGRDGRMAE
jgi:hypothetical protein